MTYTDRVVIPLPEHLANCGCRFAPHRHSTRCETAIAHDAIPLQEREGYVEGASFAAISWDYPLRLTMRVDYEVELDPELYIAENRAAYDLFQLDETGYEEWEKPIQFIAERMGDDLSSLGMWFGHPRRISWSRAESADFDEHPSWGAADTQRLHVALGIEEPEPDADAPVVDPNQGTLEIDP